MLNKFILKKLQDDYENSFDPNCAVNPLHQSKLKLLRDYLDANGLKMPKQKAKWKFDYNDISTWPLTPGRIVRDSDGNPVRHKPFNNKKFAYKHLL